MITKVRNTATPWKYTRLGGMKKRKTRHITEYINQSKGSIRIVAPIYGKSIKYDLKIPCISN